MVAFDPTYPLLPVCSIICAALLLLTFSARTLHGLRNLGVSVLCFWLFWENLFNGINAVLWADNADVKNSVYCDIVTHVQLFSSIVKPACTLVITRKLCKIALMRDPTGDSPLARRLDMALEIGLTFVLPTLATGLFYYIVQGHRFALLEGVGCQYSVSGSGLALLLILGWPVVFPAISIFFYCPRMIRALYRHRKETSRMFDSASSLSRAQYFRTLAIGSVDIIVTFPFALFKVANVVEIVLETSHGGRSKFSFYPGWHATHADFAPTVLAGEMLKTQGLWALVTTLMSVWSAVVLGLAIFVLFGLTSSARETYRRALHISTSSRRTQGESIGVRMDFARHSPSLIPESPSEYSHALHSMEEHKANKSVTVVQDVDVEYGVAR